jgi:hypothetical protein
MSTTTFKLYIDTDNAAFESGPDELARLLRKVADEVEAPHGHTRSILDVNGNRVGSWKWWDAE